MMMMSDYQHLSCVSHRLPLFCPSIHIDQRLLMTAIDRGAAHPWGGAIETGTAKESAVSPGGLGVKPGVGGWQVVVGGGGGSWIPTSNINNKRNGFYIVSLKQ